MSPTGSELVSVSLTATPDWTRFQIVGYTPSGCNPVCTGLSSRFMYCLKYLNWKRQFDQIKWNILLTSIAAFHEILRFEVNFVLVSQLLDLDLLGLFRFFPTRTPLLSRSEPVQTMRSQTSPGGSGSFQQGFSCLDVVSALLQDALYMS